MDDLKNIFDIITEVNKKLEKSIFIPSTKENIVAKPLTTQHTKRLLKTSIEGPFADTLFNIEMNTILKEILRLPTLAGLTILDKIAVLIQLRINNVSDELKLTVGGKDIPVKLMDKLNELYTLEIPEPVIVSTDEISGVIGMASIEEEFRFDSYLFNNFMKVDPEDTEKLKALILPMFVNNIAVYLQSIKVGENIMDLRSRPVTERIQIVEKLPSEFLTEVVSKIDTHLGNILSNALIIKFKVKNEEDVEIEHSHKLSIDAGFFLQ